MMMAEVMDLLDGTIVNVAGPSLKRDLGASPSSLQWIIGGYTLALGTALILGGRLGDRYGRRNTFLSGMAGFTVASVLCAIAHTTGQLITFRVLEGVAGALLLPQGLGLIREAFPPHELGKAFAVSGPIYGMGGILGPIVGGFLIQANLLNLSWRIVFLVNVPIGIIGVIAGFVILPKRLGDRGVTIDLLGTLIIAVSSLLLILPLIQGRVYNWAAWTWVSMALAPVGFFLFILRDRAVERSGKTPLVQASIFAKRQFMVGAGSLTLFFAGFTGVYLIITLFLQIGERFNASQAGVANIPIAVGTAVGGVLSGAVLSEKLGRLTLHVGAVFQFVGAIALWITLGNVTHFSVWHLVPGMALSGLGTGLIVAALFQTILTSIGNDEIGSGSGFLTAVQSIGASAGVAVFGTLFFGSATLGQFATGFRHALVAQLLLIIVFSVATLGLNRFPPSPDVVG
jgi:EmrB/QacA subfamily drug resistance transporter